MLNTCFLVSLEDPLKDADEDDIFVSFLEPEPELELDFFQNFDKNLSILPFQAKKRAHAFSLFMLTHTTYDCKG